mmetsp:Transcript_32509/g.41672  ORF Transcript_32509/g.41672 Transcript_32509/m.41672 type:complete len:418 (-) Transcript_32509:33-1286(-)
MQSDLCFPFYWGSLHDKICFLGVLSGFFLISCILNGLFVRLRRTHFFAMRSVPLVTLINAFSWFLSVGWTYYRILQDENRLKLLTFVFLSYGEVAMSFLVFSLHMLYIIKSSAELRNSALYLLLKDWFQLLVFVVFLVVHIAIFSYSCRSISMEESSWTNPIKITLTYFLIFTIVCTIFYLTTVTFGKLKWSSDDLGISKELILVIIFTYPLAGLLAACVMKGWFCTTTSLFFVLNAFPTIFFLAFPLYLYKQEFMRVSPYAFPQPGATRSKNIPSSPVVRRVAPETLARTLEQKLRDPEESKRISARAKRRFCEEYVDFLKCIYDYQDRVPTAMETEQNDLFSDIMLNYIGINAKYTMDIPLSLQSAILKYRSKAAFDLLQTEEKRNIFNGIAAEIETLLMEKLNLDYDQCASNIP